MWDVIVVGARTAGAPLAMLLARAGLRVLLTDRAAFPSDTLDAPDAAPGRRSPCSMGTPGHHRSCDPRDDPDPAGRRRRHCERQCPSYGGIGAMYSRAAPCWTPSLSTLPAPPEQKSGRFTVKELRWTSGCVTGIRGQERGSGPVTETARLVVGADGKHSFVADGVASPRYRKRPAATFASYSYWADVPMTGGGLYQRAERAAAAFRPTTV